MLAALIAASIAVSPEVEILGGGLIGGSNDPKALMFSARIGADFNDVVTASAYFIGVPGPEARYASGSVAGQGVNPSGMQAWSALAELRVHSTTPTPVKVHFGVAAGVGQLLNWQCADDVNCTENMILNGHPAFAAAVSAGIRYRPPRWGGFFIGGQTSVNVWTGQDDLGPGQGWQQRGATRVMFGLQASLGYRW